MKPLASARLDLLPKLPEQKKTPAFARSREQHEKRVLTLSAHYHRTREERTDHGSRLAARMRVICSFRHALCN